MGEYQPLAGKRVLVAEDNFLVAEEMRRSIENAGGTVSTQKDAITLEQVAETAPRIHCAVLDLGLERGLAIKSALVLRRHRIPFIIVSGYDRGVLPAELRDVPFIDKPANPHMLVELVARTAR